MEIRDVRTVDQLNDVLQFVHGIFPQLANAEDRYSRAFWMEKLEQLPELLLYASDGARICGSVFGFDEGGGITVGHCCIAEKSRRQGIGRSLILELEERARRLGYSRIVLGAVEKAEGFYSKLGYSGSLLIQSEDHSVDELLEFNKTYEVIGTSVWNGTVNQLWLRIPLVADRAFRREYEKALPGCNTQVVFGKDL